MIPIRLQIKGLYSYRESIEIDFEKLAEGHLFGIFGAVGSGKSAILEAITYALYGNTERLNASGDNRNYNMMNLQSQEMLIEFEFWSGVSGNEERFLFRVKQSRNSKRFEDVKSPARSALQWKNGEWEALPSTDATEILRLSYDNFIKTIIIPQGKFQEFLHMGPTPRTRMLREIFSLDRFELDRPTRALLAKTKEDLVRIEEQLKPLSAASESEIAEQQVELDATTAQLKQSKANAEQLQATLNQLRQLKSLSEKIQISRGELSKLAFDKPSIELRAEKLQRFSQLKTDFSELLNSQKRLDREWKAAESKFQEAAVALEKLGPQLELAKQTLANCQVRWEGRAAWESQIRDCDHWLKIKDAEAEILTLEGRLANGQTAIQQVREKVLATTQARSEEALRISQAQAEMPDLALIGEAQLWFQQQMQIQQQLREIDNEVAQLVQHRSGIQEDLQNLAQTVGLQWDAALGLDELLEQEIVALKASFAQARDARDHMSQQSGLATYAIHLHDGEPCPLCGAADHPNPYHTGQAQRALDQANVQIRNLELDLAGKANALQQAQGFSIRQQENIRQQSILQEKRGSQEKLLSQHQAAFQWPQYAVDAPEAVEADRNKAKQLQESIANAEKKRQVLEERLLKEQEDVQRYEAGLQTLLEQKNQQLGKRDSLLQQLTQLLPADNASKARESFEQLRDELMKELASAEKALNAAQALEKQLALDIAKTEAERNSAAAERQRLQAELVAIQSKLDAALSQAGLPDVAALHEILAWNLNVESEQAAIQNFRNRILALETELRTLESAAQSMQYQADVHEKAETDWIALQKAVEDLQQKQTLLLQAIQTLQSNLLMRKGLEATQHVLQVRQENLKSLESLFKASGFVKYVSTIYLQDLIKRADVRFKRLTRNALSLELGDENDFLVRDMLNGGQTRSVKTLSGGQTFQASLCLALALADIVQQSNKSSHNFFFLDEGFGTLDKDSLSAVFDALKQLREENRIVGVISHVEDLQQEIDTHLKVMQSEERGSWVKGSWE